MCNPTKRSGIGNFLFLFLWPQILFFFFFHACIGNYALWNSWCDRFLRHYPFLARKIEKWLNSMFGIWQRLKNWVKIQSDVLIWTGNVISIFGFHKLTRWCWKHISGHRFVTFAKPSKFIEVNGWLNLPKIQLIFQFRFVSFRSSEIQK